jgi:hypothetical protein
VILSAERIWLSALAQAPRDPVREETQPQVELLVPRWARRVRQPAGQEREAAVGGGQVVDRLDRAHQRGLLVQAVFGRAWTVRRQDGRIQLPVSVTPLFVEE